VDIYESVEKEAVSSVVEGLSVLNDEDGVREDMSVGHVFEWRILVC